MTAPTAACVAARTSAAVFSLSRSHIELTGKDRVAFLHSFCTNDIKSLVPGQACEAFLCNVKGRVLGHVMVYAQQHSLWLETVAGAAPGLIAHLDRYLIREDVQFHDRTTETAELHLVGPNSVAALASVIHWHEHVDAVEDRLAKLGINTFASWVNAKTMEPFVSRTVDWLGEPSYLLAGAPPVIERLQQEAIEDGVIVGSNADWQSLRIAAGFPLYGVDLTDDHLPQEAARNDRCLSFTKGCYLGQEPIARLDAMGHTNRELRRLRLPSDTRPMTPSPLVDPGTGQEAGVLTSCAASPDGPGGVALGMLKTKWQPPGTTLHVLIDGIPHAAVVV
jgi:folate-binding protein YgfZ